MKNKTLSFGVMGLHIAFGLAFLSLISTANITSDSIGFKDILLILFLVLILGISFFYPLQIFIDKEKAKYFSYVITFLAPLFFVIRFILQYISYLKEPPIYPWSWQGAAFPIVLVFLPCLLLIFLSFSPHLYLDEKGSIVTENSSLDAPFITNQEVSNSSYFWRIHRTFAIILMFISIICFGFALFAKTLPFYIGTFISSLFCLLLWFRPRLGSILFSFFCMLILMSCSFYFVFLLKPVDYSTSVFFAFATVFLFIGSIPFILINDTTREEWKMK